MLFTIIVIVKRPRCKVIRIRFTSFSGGVANRLPFYAVPLSSCEDKGILTSYSQCVNSISQTERTQIERWFVMKNEALVIKKRGEDGSRVITVRIKEDTLTALDQLAAETNYSRNELINIILKHGVENIQIE